MTEAKSSYMLFFREPAKDMYANMTAQDREDLGQEWNRWYEELATAGKVQHGLPLHPESRMVSGPRGEQVVDGPFAEAKEAIGGYFLLTVSGIDEATEIAQRCPSLRLGMRVEVRAVAEFCPTLGVHGRPAVTVATA